MRHTIRLLITIVALAAIFVMAWPSVPVRAMGIPDPRFGVIEAYDAPHSAAALGAGWTRVTFRWNEIQLQGSEEWNITAISDQQLATERAHGRQVVGLLVTTPGWATDMGIGPGVPQGLYLPPNDPNNHWANFVRRIVSQYAGRIDHWIIWNEPDIPDTQHMSWGGSVEDFVQLLRVGYAVAHEANPNAVVHMSAVTHWWNEHWFGQFLDVLAADPNAAANNYYFDIATLHIYFQPEHVYDLTAHYYRLMHNRNIYKPIWIVETNAAPSEDPAWPVPNAQFHVTLEEQAFFIVQAFSLGIVAGAERIAVYKMIDTESDRAANPEPFGLVRMDGSPRPAFTTYQVAATHLSGFRGGTWDRRDDVSVVTVDRGERTTTVVWSRVPEAQTAMVPARTTQALLIDIWGSARYVYPDRGYYFVELAGADCTGGCQVGGPPLMLVEDVTSEAPSAAPPDTPEPASESDAEGLEEEPTDAPTPDPNALPTATPTFTPTPTPTPTLTATPTRTPSPSPTPMPTETPMPTSSPTPTASPVPTLVPTATPTIVPVHVAAYEALSGSPWLWVGMLVLIAGGGALFWSGVRGGRSSHDG